VRQTLFQQVADLGRVVRVLRAAAALMAQQTVLLVAAAGHLLLVERLRPPPMLPARVVLERLHQLLGHL
jgi:hypothetical protein